MSLEDTVRTLLDDAVPLLRRAVQNATVDALVSGVTEPVRGLLRRAYEAGYREGLAARPDVPPEPPAASSGGGPTPTSIVPGATLAASGIRFDDDDDFEPDEPTDSASTRPIVEDEREQVVGSSPAASVDWGADDSTARVAGADRPRTAPSLRIFPHATVGTLRDRIIDTFDLERFDIDVVIARKGDRSRRQLKATVKLSKYALEGER